MEEETKIIYPELSYKIIGIAYKIFNTLGFGHKEIFYQRAFANELQDSKINFKRESRYPIFYKNKTIGTYIPDFLIEDKIVVELKVRPKIGYTHIKQTLNYLRTTNLKLAIIIYFTKDGVKSRRIVNIQNN
jgi:GxxExxY protein